MVDDAYEFLIRRLQKARAGWERIEQPENKNSELCDRLKNENARGPLTLVLGAGVSSGSKLPDWKTLITRVTEEIFDQIGQSSYAHDFTSSALSELRKIRFLESHSRAFRLLLRDSLYKDWTPESNSLLHSIADFSARNLENHRNQTIITYNFDDLLEERLRGIGLSEQIGPVYSEPKFRSETAPIRIYHPHGYLPRDGCLEELLQAFLVFSEPQYHFQYQDSGYWANLCQKTAFMTTTCLFVGLSFSDPNLRRLLDHASARGDLTPRHIAVVRSQRQVKTTNLDVLSNAIIEKDLLSFGIQPYWVDDFDQIPLLLDSI